MDAEAEREKIHCIIKRHHAARRMRLRVTRDGKVVVTIPKRGSVAVAEQFVARHGGWIREQLEAFRQTKQQSFFPPGTNYHAYRLRAQRLVRDKIVLWNRHYGVPFNKISIRAQSTRWGSCSRSGTLSFNYKLFFLPDHLVDYIIVHELCHVREMNHGKKFWALVAETVPDHVGRRAELRHYRV